MTRYVTWVRMPNGQIVKVYTNANSSGEAKQIFEATYSGNGVKVLHLPTPAVD